QRPPHTAWPGPDPRQRSWPNRGWHACQHSTSVAHGAPSAFFAWHVPPPADVLQKNGVSHGAAAAVPPGAPSPPFWTHLPVTHAADLHCVDDVHETPFSNGACVHFRSAQ